jgi:hypothetical protein
VTRRSAADPFSKRQRQWGASLAWVGPAHGSRVKWHERRDLCPQGVASGDPDPHSVILWTRRPFTEGTRHLLTVEVAEDEAFTRVVANAKAPVSSVADWTTRVLIGGLKPAHTYWYRFTDTDGNGSRVGRTITAPSPDDPRPVNFAFVSCQDVNEGKLNGYRRMIYEDERAPATLAAGARKIARPGADAACDEFVSRKPLAKYDTIRESRIPSSSQFQFVRKRPWWRCRPAINEGGSRRGHDWKVWLEKLRRPSRPSFYT